MSVRWLVLGLNVDLTTFEAIVCTALLRVWVLYVDTHTCAHTLKHARTRQHVDTHTHAHVNKHAHLGVVARPQQLGTLFLVVEESRRDVLALGCVIGGQVHDDAHPRVDLTQILGVGVGVLVIVFVCVDE